MFFYSWTIDFQAIIHLAPFETCAVPNDDGGFPLHAAPRSTHPPLNRSPPVNLSTSKLCRANFPHQIRMDRCFLAPSSTPQFALTLYQVPSSIFLLLENIFVPEFPRFPCSWQLKLLHNTEQSKRATGTRGVDDVEFVLFHKANGQVRLQQYGPAQQDTPNLGQA